MEGTFVDQLQQEIAAWQRERLLSDRQAHTLLARYGLGEGELEVRRSRFVYALVFLGALLIGIGVIAFFAANWPFIPGWVKLLLILSAVILAYTAGYWMRFERQWAPRAGDALIFLGALLFGAAIFLVALGFHVRAGRAYPALPLDHRDRADGLPAGRSDSGDSGHCGGRNRPRLRA